MSNLLDHSPSRKVLLTIFSLVIPFGVTFTADMAFYNVFAFRYFRLLVNFITWFTYRPAPESLTPKYTPREVTVIIPTTEMTHDLINCVVSIIANNPRSISVVTVGQTSEDKLREYLLKELSDRGVSLSTGSSGLVLTHRNDGHEDIDINIYHYAGSKANKRQQIMVAVKKHEAEGEEAAGNGKITALVDASVIWPATFLTNALAPFEEDSTWLVGTSKRVEREEEKRFWENSWGQFWLHLGCLYLERHNWDLRGTNGSFGDGFVISGRTMLIRPAILEWPRFQVEYLNEYLVNGLVGPLNADDDNMIDRWVKTREGGIKFQYTKEALLGIAPIAKDWKRFCFEQCKRWAQTTFRSNPRALGIASIWKYQPYSVYSIYLSGMLNFALLFDGIMVILFSYTTLVQDKWWMLLVLIFWIICTKMIKLATYYWRQPRDLVFFPGYILFAYFHSFIKLWALLTFWDISWAGRNLEIADASDAEEPQEVALDRESVSPT